MLRRERRIGCITRISTHFHKYFCITRSVRQFLLVSSRKRSECSPNQFPLIVQVPRPILTSVRFSIADTSTMCSCEYVDWRTTDFYRRKNENQSLFTRLNDFRADTTCRLFRKNNKRIVPQPSVDYRRIAFIRLLP